MPTRFKSTVLLAFTLLVLYLVFVRDDSTLEYGQHAIDVFNGNLKDIGYYGASEGASGEPLHDEQPEEEEILAHPEPTVSSKSPPAVNDAKFWTWTISPTRAAKPEAPTAAAGSIGDANSSKENELPEVEAILEDGNETEEPPADAEDAAVADDNDLDLQKEFEEKYSMLGVTQSAGEIYGRTLSELIDSSTHEGFADAALTIADSSSYSDALLYTYNPYPDYNSKVWKANYKGTYTACGPVQDVKVFSGHPEIFGEPHIGSYVALDIDSNLCFERESRLAAYGYVEENSAGSKDESSSVEKYTEESLTNWGILQLECEQKNFDRYTPGLTKSQASNYSMPAGTNSSRLFNSTAMRRRLEIRTGDDDPQKSGADGTRKTKAEVMSRKAVIIRTSSDQKYTKTDILNIRALVSELSLRSGGEYQVFLLVQVKDEALPIWADPTVHMESVHENIPQEFWNMTVLWNNAKMEEAYPLIPSEANNAEKSPWLSIQMFAQEYTEFTHYWNWDFESRYTGHYYDLLEKLASFAKGQPRKYLWERNERYYIPSVHSRLSKFRLSVEKVSGSDTVWGAPTGLGIKPVGPVKPGPDPEEDMYKWGIGEEADFISLSPIFNPVDTNWGPRNDVWGFEGEDTPRRATIGTQSRCSKKLLNAMHAANVKGNHVGGEMMPPTIALLHGLKPVFAPIPMFFDRAWDGPSLERYFNPGPKGQSGSTPNSPFSEENQDRFEGSTWHDFSEPPMRLYNNWMGLEDHGIGGPEWEADHGRTCLPPILLRSIKDVAESAPSESSKSDIL